MQFDNGAEKSEFNKFAKGVNDSLTNLTSQMAMVNHRMEVWEKSLFGDPSMGIKGLVGQATENAAAIRALEKQHNALDRETSDLRRLIVGLQDQVNSETKLRQKQWERIDALESKVSAYENRGRGIVWLLGIFGFTSILSVWQLIQSFIDTGGP